MDTDRNRSEITPKEREIILNRAIRKDGFREGILKKYADVRKRKGAEEKLQLFFEQLFCYLELLLEAHGLKGSADKPGEQVSFYPFGNGWRFLEVLDNGSIDQYLEHWFRSRGFNVHVVGVQKFDGADRKGTVAIGALRFADPRVAAVPHAFIRPEDQDPIKSVIGCDVVVSYDAVERNIRKHKAVPWMLKQDFANMERSFQSDKWPIISTRQFIESLKLQKRHGAKDIEISQDFNGVCKEKALAPTKENSWKVKRSLFAIFLEDIFPDYYLNA